MTSDVTPDWGHSAADQLPLLVTFQLSRYMAVFDVIPTREQVRFYSFAFYLSLDIISRQRKSFGWLFFFECPCHFDGRHFHRLLVWVTVKLRLFLQLLAWWSDTRRNQPKQSQLGPDWNLPRLHLWGGFTFRLWIMMVSLRWFLFKRELVRLWGILWSGYFKATWKKKKKKNRYTVA